MLKPINKNLFAVLVTTTTRESFLRWDGFTKKVGDTIGEWVLLIPLLPDPDGKEQWIVSNNNQFGLCSPASDDPDYIILIDNIAHFLKDLQPHMGSLRPFIPRLFQFEEFESLAKSYGAYCIEESDGNAVAKWEKYAPSMMICYGRLLELVPNPNEVVALEKEIRISKLKREES